MEFERTSLVSPEVELRIQQEIIWALIRALEQSEQEKIDLRRQAVHDTLVTSVLNQGRTLAELERRVEKGAFFGVFVIDINNFKQINDILGHAVGDEVLIALGRLLDAAFRRDTDEVGMTAGRMGGDEFMVFIDLEDLGGQRSVDGTLQMDNAHEVIMCIAAELAAAYPPIAELGFGLSVGGAWYYPDSNISASLLRNQADEAMYEEKGENGR